MKSLFTLLLLLGLVQGSHAQYYYLPELYAGQNPKGLNKDLEEPGAAGWTDITTTNANPIWSSIVSLPFDFNFNGELVTSYKVSTTGVLTFTTSAIAVPGTINNALPSASIPENSIMVWGLSAQGANDAIRRKTFGVAPNRQHWIQFSAYSAPGSVGENFTYWSIVLEEGSNDIYIVDQRTFLTPLSLTLGIQIDGVSAFAVAGAPNSASLGTSSLNTPADNVYYRFVFGTQPVNDAKLSKLTFSTNAGAGTVIPITGIIQNFGTSTINTLQIKYEANGQTQTQVLNNLAVASGESYVFNHASTFVVPSPGRWPVKVWISLVGDANKQNDTLRSSILAKAFEATKRLVFEEATGTWCGWCPRGAVYMDSLAKLYPTTALAIAVHNNDPMAIEDYDGGLNTLTSGYPSGVIDRKKGDFDPSQFIQQYNAQINPSIVACDVTVNATFNATTRVYSIALSSKFAIDLQGDFRFNCVIVEDDVTGTGSGYDQSNSYAGGGNGAMGNYHNLPSPVPAAQMVYDHVARAILGGWEGTASSIPTTIANNSVHTYNYSYTLPSRYDASQIRIIGWVMDAATGEILNANQKNFSVGIVTQEASDFSLSIFPNPSKGHTNFEVKMDHLKDEIKLEVFDLTGRLIYETSEGSALGGSKFLVWEASDEVANGIYQAVVRVGNEFVAAKVAIAR